MSNQPPSDAASAESDETSPPNAGIMRRLAALVYDALLIVALWIVVGFVALAINGGEIIAGWLPRGLLYGACLAITFAFYWKFWRDGGQTAGMRAWRIKLESHDGMPVSHSQCANRFAVAVASAGIGTLWMLFDPEHLTLQDRVSNTRVVLTPKRKKIRRVR